MKIHSINSNTSQHDEYWENLEQEVWKLFSPAAPINTTDLFAGRREQIKRFLRALNEQGRHVILYGERGVGKTSLVNIVRFLIESEKSPFVSVRKQASPEDNFTSLWRKVFRNFRYTKKEEIGYGKEDTNITTIADYYREEITSDDVARELEGISHTSEATVIVIFDEFDKIYNLDTKKLMSHTIKLLSDSGVNSTIVLVGVAEDINTLVEEHESVKRNIEEIKMPRMSQEELDEILKERLPKLNITVDEKARKKIINLSGGLPEYVHALGRNAAINAISNKRLNINTEDVDSAIKTFLLQSDQSSNSAFKKATHSNQKHSLYSDVLLACALAKPTNDGKFTASAVIEPLNRVLKRKISISNFQSHLVAFCSKERGNILERYGTSRAFKYRFREPKMQQYVIMKGLLSGKIDDNTPGLSHFS